MSGGWRPLGLKMMDCPDSGATSFPVMQAATPRAIIQDITRGLYFAATGKVNDTIRGCTACARACMAKVAGPARRRRMDGLMPKNKFQESGMVLSDSSPSTFSSFTNVITILKSPDIW